MSEIRFLLYIYSGILFTLFVGVIIAWAYLLFLNINLGSPILSIDRLSLYSIILLSIIGSLLFFNLKKLWRVYDADFKDIVKRLKNLETTPSLDTRLKNLETTPSLDTRLKMVENTYVTDLKSASDLINSLETRMGDLDNREERQEKSLTRKYFS
jgi:hypothetical protein